MMRSSSARLVLMCGPPGSGKTTLARRLTVQLSAISFSPDEWLTQLGVEMDHPLREELGDLQWRLTQELLAKGQSVVMESGHWMREERDEKDLSPAPSECKWSCSTYRCPWKNCADALRKEPPSE